MTTPKEPRWLDDPEAQKRARFIRDRQWETLERIADCDPLYICWWDKAGRHRDRDRRPEDLKVCGLIDGMELLQWLNAHPDWREIGEWSDERYAAPVWITEAGRAALANREPYDREPVVGGLVEPGWQTIPAPPDTGSDADKEEMTE